MKLPDIRSKFNKKTVTSSKKKVVTFIEKNPFKTFIITLVLLFGFIFLSSLVTKKPPAKTDNGPIAKEVSTYKIGKAPKITLQAKIEKSGVIQIVAQSPGVVQNIPVEVGQHVSRGTYLVNLSTNYQGGNAAGLQAAMSYQQNKLVNDTYDTQKDIIAKQREVAEKSDVNADALRDISVKSIDETKSLLSLNEDIINNLDQSINEASTSAQALPFKQLKSQYLSATNQIRNSLRQLEYQTNTDNAPSDLSNLQKDIALKQLDIQSKTLDLNREISNIQLQLAYVSESLMHPAALCNGVVERIYVKVGQSVSPGTPIAMISTDIQSSVAIARVPRTTATNISMLETSILHIGASTFDTYPTYISTEATDGQLYSVYFALPDNYRSQTTNNEYILVEVPIGYPDTSSTIPFLPLDAIFQTQDEAYVNVVEKHKAVSRKITLGQVYGRYVEVQSGIKSGDQIILNRTIIEGDTVK